MLRERKKGPDGNLSVFGFYHSRTPENALGKLHQILSGPFWQISNLGSERHIVTSTMASL